MTWKRRTPAANRRRRHRRERGYISYSQWKESGGVPGRPQPRKFRLGVLAYLRHFNIAPRSYWHQTWWGRIVF